MGRSVRSAAEGVSGARCGSDGVQRVGASFGGQRAAVAVSQRARVM